MPHIPDRFDLWVRKAKEHSDPDRQTDYVLGALAGLKEWHFLNIGTAEKPQAAKTEIDADPCLLVFSDLNRLEELLNVSGAVRHLQKYAPLPAITIPTAAALPWCVECKIGLLINPGEDAVMVPFEQVEAFHAEWSKRGGRQASGYWIPNMTTEEEDFWQKHGL
jgi:hypothetical protein